MKFGLPFTITSAADRQQWSDAAFRRAKFLAATEAVAAFLATLNVDILALTEIGNADEVALLAQALADQGVPYAHVEVCACTDRTTR